MTVRFFRSFCLVCGCLLIGGLVARGTAAEARTGKPLRVFFIDVEGGQATLFVTPKGHSLLIDTGWSGHEGRDADRIVAAAKKAGLGRIDDVLITHFHQDHVGGVPQLVARIPVGRFIDHGENRELDRGQVEKDYGIYQGVLAVGAARHLVAHAGDVLTMGEMTVRVLSGDGKVLAEALIGAGQVNEFCPASEVRAADQTENARSLGVEVTFGKLRILDLGDLTWNKEMEMMCPVNRIGKVDVLVVSHHGWLQSSSPALVDAVHARVAVMDNGETKGGSMPTFETLDKAPGLEALWQIHASKEAGEKNRGEGYVANLLGRADAGFGLELIGGMDGGFAVKNERTGLTVRYGVGR